MTDLLLTKDWCNKLRSFKRLIVAYSGGLDSTTLLHALHAQLSDILPIMAIHINHSYSVHANQWESHCQSFCLSLNIPIITKSIQLTSLANFEEVARNARYSELAHYVTSGDALVLAHHADDQVETFFLQLFRGAGMDGLAAMHDCSPFAKGHLLRPFLGLERRILEAYAEQYDIPYVEDESNADLRFSRNFIRKELLPLIKQRWPSYTQNILRTISHSQQAAANLEQLALLDLASMELKSEYLSIENLRNLPLNRQINVIRNWLKQHSSRMPSQAILTRIYEDVLAAKADANPCVFWKGGGVRRYRNQLFFIEEEPAISIDKLDWSDYPNPLIISESGTKLMVKNPPDILRGKCLQIAYRSGGESILYHKHHRSLKKLMQQWGIPTWQRSAIPLIFSDNDLIAVVGYANADSLPESCQFIVINS